MSTRRAAAPITLPRYWPRAGGSAASHIAKWGGCACACTIWVDLAWYGSENGSFSQPFDTLAEAMAAVCAKGLIRIKPGSRPETGTFGSPSTIKSYNGPVTIGR